MEFDGNSFFGEPSSNHTYHLEQIYVSEDVRRVVGYLAVVVSGPDHDENVLLEPNLY